MRRWIIALALVATAFARPAAALDAAAVEKLAYGDSEERIGAISALVTENDPRALAVFQALAEGDLKREGGEKGKRVFIVKGDAASDAVTGERIAALPADAEDVRLNNRLRGAVQGALAALKLASSFQATRLAAARE